MAGGMTRAALLRNPASARNARQSACLRPLARELGLMLAEPDTLSALRHALGNFRDAGVELLAVDGGDGTMREVLTALAELAWTPRLAVLPSGKINLIAHDVGLAKGGEAGWRMVAAMAHGGWDSVRVQHRHLLRLDRPGERPVHGMFAGAATFAAACAMANRHLHPRGIDSTAAVAGALAWSLGRALFGELRHGHPMSVAVDGDAPVNGRHFLVLATTLERLTLGLWPFWPDGAGGMHILDIKAPPRRLARAVFPLLRGRPAPWMVRAGYRSGNAAAMEIEGGTPVVLDGEAFPAAPGGWTRLSAGPVVEFVQPC